MDVEQKDEGESGQGMQFGGGERFNRRLLTQRRSQMLGSAASGPSAAA